MPKPQGMTPMFEGWDATVFKPKDGKDRPGLYLEECSYQAAKYAVENWHYSHLAPIQPCLSSCFGVWEDGTFRGVVALGQGAGPMIGNPFGLGISQTAELIRIALTKHDAPVTRIVAIALRRFRRNYPEARLLVSFADSARGHLGGIYQAGNWVYVGTSVHVAYLVNGLEMHSKSVENEYGPGSQSVSWLRAHVDPLASRIIPKPKHKYLYPLDAAMRAQIEPLRKPYPKCVGSAAVGTSGLHPESGGPNPTPTLQEVAV